MARVYFLYRSTKDKAALKVRLQDKGNNGKYFQFEANTQIHTTKTFWNETRLKKRGLTGNEKNEITEINKKTQSLENIIIQKYEVDNPQPQQKNWLKDVLSEHYKPKQTKKTYSLYLVEFIDNYLDDKRALNELKENQRKRINTTKNKLKKIEAENKKRYKLIDINFDFKADYVSYSQKYQYSINTQNKEFDRIKTICRYASKKGFEISNDIEDKDFKIKKEKTPKIYLENKEIELIQKATFEHDYLDNARDWLLISIYSGQRVSDFMRFNSDMIHKEQSGRTFVIFKQQKIGHNMYLPLRPEMQTILDKRNGEFPRKISDQKYNEYIKEVCKIAGLNTLCKGKKRICIDEDKPKKDRKHTDYRDVLGEFEKWELVSSHIGRRTFATLNYGNIPTPDLMYFTGHTTEREFLNYIVRPDYEKAKRAFDRFNSKDKPKEIPSIKETKLKVVNQ